MLPPTLLFIPDQAARDRLFMRSLVTRFKSIGGKSLLLHHTGGETPEVSFYVSKRISALLSEEMVTNTALAGYHRNLVRLEPEPALRLDLLYQLWANVDVVVLSTTLATASGQPGVGSPHAILGLMRHALNPSQVLLFPQNPSSALAMEPRTVSTAEEADQLLGLFPEEAETLGLARMLRPARVLAANHIGQ